MAKLFSFDIRRLNRYRCGHCNVKAYIPYHNAKPPWTWHVMYIISQNCSHFSDVKDTWQNRYMGIMTLYLMYLTSLKWISCGFLMEPSNQTFLFYAYFRRSSCAIFKSSRSSWSSSSAWGKHRFNLVCAGVSFDRPVRTESGCEIHYGIPLAKCNFDPNQ